MRQPGRPSSAAAALAYGHGPERLKPPAGLDGELRQIWLDLVTAAKPEHFQPVDAPLLALFCRMVVQAERASGEIAKDMAAASPSLLQAQAQAVKAVHDLSMRLRVSPQARSGHLTRRTREVPRSSYYDRAALEHDGDAAN
jgi:phage terminase small subunit